MSSQSQANSVLPSQARKVMPQINFRWTQQITAYLFLLPAIVLFATFAWYPILRAIEMSFQEVQLTGQSTWVGLDNYALMLRDPALPAAWGNSFMFATWSIILGFLFPIVISICVREMRVARGFFRIVYFLPTVVPAAIAVLIWRFIYDPDGGFMNSVFVAFGLERQQWLQDALLVKPSIVAMMTWGAFGATALIYLSTLQEIPTELYEAAELDGASPWQRITNITMPYLYPVMSVLFVLQVIAVVQVFTEPFLMTNGGPGRESLTPAMHIYNRAFIRFDLGYASAWSVTMIVVLFMFSIVHRVINHRLNPN
jgi:multiple sugar transport system permease protein